MLTDLILSLFIAFYLLSSRDKRVAQIRKFRHAVFTEKQDAKITAVVRLTDKTFNGFVFGVLIDALVVGVLTFLMLSIFEVSPYNLLIATIVAVTNVIPVFGPFIGAIPSAFIVLISNPSKVFLFIILILIIQQVDGNILCPKIQGDNTGVSSLAVLIAITVAGGMWGLGGMVIGVPIIAVIIEMGKRAIEERLIRKGKPVETTAYYPEDALGNAEKDVYYEHAGLRYEYEHSRFKHRFDRLRRRLLGDESNSKDSNDGAADGHTSEPTNPRSTEKKNKRKSNKK
jgi:predicted PurR-regulated permease PerM